MPNKKDQDEGFTPLWRRIEEVMRACEWTEEDLRREINLTPQDVYNLKRRNRTLGAERAIVLQKKTKFFAEWVNYNRGPKRVFELTPDEQRMVEESRENPSVRDAIYALLGLRP
jgi:hypothetical protein